MSATLGRFVRFDLITTDVKAAKDFYGEVLGWRTSAWPGGRYEVWSVGGTQIGGLVQLGTEARKATTEPQWRGYVAAKDVDATAGRGKRLGGSVLIPGQDILGVGRFAVLADPQGAAFAVFASANGEVKLDPTALGHFAWSELDTTDWQGAWRFYAEMFGWLNTSTLDMGIERGAYFMFGPAAGEAIGGMSNSAKLSGARPRWMHYVNVKNVDAASKVVTRLGGKVLHGPMDIPGGGRIVQCADAQGAWFALHTGPKK